VTLTVRSVNVQSGKTLTWLPGQSQRNTRANIPQLSNCRRTLVAAGAMQKRPDKMDGPI
jgi:hypothetical protein